LLSEVDCGGRRKWRRKFRIEELPGACPFTLERSVRSYRLNKFLRRAASRWKTSQNAQRAKRALFRGGEAKAGIITMRHHSIR